MLNITRDMSNKFTCDNVPIGVVNVTIWFIVLFCVKKVGENYFFD